MYHQSDFYQKKSFANPNLFNNSGANAGGGAVDKGLTQPMPAPGRPDSIANTTTTTTVAGTSNPRDEQSKKDHHEEIGAGHLFKHPLQNTWTLWYLEHDHSKSWEDMQNEITSFDTVEDFWSLYNHIKPPSDIKAGSDYSLFKQGIRPMWEDAANKQGGRWVIQLNKISKPDLDHLWLDVLLCLIGEAFEYSEEICGAVINIRKGYKISIWTANGANSEAVLKIGHKLREELRLGRHSLNYQLHKDTMVKQGSTYKSIHTI